MRISDWSSDVCSSDLRVAARVRSGREGGAARYWAAGCRALRRSARSPPRRGGKRAAIRHVLAVRRESRRPFAVDRKSVVEGKSVSVRVDLGGGRIIKKKKKKVEETIQYILKQK